MPIVPYMPLSEMIMIGLAPYCTAVAISLPDIKVPPSPTNATTCVPGRRAALQERLDDLVRTAGHAEIGPPHAADLVRVGPDMDERQLRLRRGGKAVGLADRIGHPLAERHHQIGLLHLADQSRRHPDP